MRHTNSQTLPRRDLCGLIILMMVAAWGAPPAGAAEPPGIDEIKARLARQRGNIESLYVRVRRAITLSADPKSLSLESWRLPLPEHLGTDEVLFALKGRQRYRRLLGLNCRPFESAGSSGKGDHAIPATFDVARAFDGTVLRAREKGFTSPRFQYRSLPPEKAYDSFPPSQYLINVGWAMPDPTARDESRLNLQQMHFLPELLELWPYDVSAKLEDVGGTACVVLEGQMHQRLPGGEGGDKKNVSDKLWLSSEHGLAIRRRETRVDGQLVRVVNSDFEEVIPGLWLPKQSRVQTYGPPEAPEQFRERPVLICNITLCFRLVNQVADELFDVVLTRPDHAAIKSLHDTVAAYHYRRIEPQVPTLPGQEPPDLPKTKQTHEVWMRRGVGRRVETRKGRELTFVIVDTPRWRLLHDVASNRVAASPSQLADRNVGDDDAMLSLRDPIIRMWEQSTAGFVCEDDTVDGKEVEKITFYCPVDVIARGEWPIHSFEPEKHLELSGTEFRTRQYWFDRRTGRQLGYRCGCQTPRSEEWIDFPSPESLPPKRFTFRVPRDALLEINDPELGRQVYSEGQTEPDLRE